MEILIISNNKTLVNWELKTPSQKYKEGLEEVAKKINADTRLKKTAVFVLGSLFYTQQVLAVDPLAKINKAGSQILGIARGIGYWVCIIGAVIDIIKSVMQGDAKSIAKTIMKFGLAFAALYLLPWIFDLIKAVFA